MSKTDYESIINNPNIDEKEALNIVDNLGQINRYNEDIVVALLDRKLLSIEKTCKILLENKSNNYLFQHALNRLSEVKYNKLPEGFIKELIDGYEANVEHVLTVLNSDVPIEFRRRFIIDLINHDDDFKSIISFHMSNYCKEDKTLSFIGALISRDETSFENYYTYLTDPWMLSILSKRDIAKETFKNSRDKEFRNKFKFYSKMASKSEYIQKFNAYMKSPYLIGRVNRKSSNTSLIRSTDIFEFNNDKITIKPNNFDLIEYKSDEYDNGEVIYGEYPLIEAKGVLDSSLNMLYELNQLEKTGKKYRLSSNIVTKVALRDESNEEAVLSFDEYIFNNRKFIRLIFNNEQVPRWIEVVPIRWRINREERTLEMIDAKKISDLYKEFNFHIIDKNHQAIYYKYNLEISNLFKSDILEPYAISDEDFLLRSNLKSNNKSKFIDIREQEKK